MRPDLLSIREAAEEVGVSRATLRRWHASERLVPVQIDCRTRYRYYSREQLQAFNAVRWERTHQPRPTQLGFFTFIDLFAGIGGFRQAFGNLGGECVFTSEIDPFACRTYQANFHEMPAGDITQIAATDIPPHDILVGGFPCQPFSIAGVSKYGSLGWEHGFLHRTKGTLFFDIARILEYHRPPAFVLENVKNLRSHDGGRTMQVILETLRELGYTVHAKIIDARTVVPQHRERIFIVGFRDAVPFEFPVLPDLHPRVADILEPGVDPKYTLSDHLWTYLQEYAARHRAAGNGFGFGLVDPEGITRTLSARYHKDGSEILIPQEGKNPRRLTPRECARLMGFPEDFDIPVSDTQAYRQFGNAVVVPVALAVATSVVEALHHRQGTLLTLPLAARAAAD